RVQQFPAPCGGCRGALWPEDGGHPRGAGPPAHGRWPGGHDRRRRAGPARCTHATTWRSHGMNESTLREIAAQLDAARLQGTPLPPLASTYPGLGVEQAYRIQQWQTERRLAAGAREVGKKIGLTSHAVQSMLGVDQPDFGALFDDM